MFEFIYQKLSQKAISYPKKSIFQEFNFKGDLQLVSVQKLHFELNSLVPICCRHSLE